MVDCSFLLKRALGGFCLALVASAMQAQAPNVSWFLDHVTCHEVGALLHFEGDVSVPQSQRVLLEGLPEDVDVAHAKVELPAGIALMSINKVSTSPDVADDVAWLTKQVDARRLALDLELALLHSLDQERAYLEANRSIGSENEILLVDDVEEMRHYLAQKHQELALRRVDIASNVRDLELQLQSAESDLAALKAEATREMHGLELVLAGEGRGSIEVEVATQRAGWVSSYDVSWDDQTGQLDVRRYARVVQTTGMDWDDVALELRTGQPIGTIAPRRSRSEIEMREGAANGSYCASAQWVNSGLSDMAAKHDVIRHQGSMASNWSMATPGRVSVDGGGAAARLFLDSHLLDATPQWVVRPNSSESAILSCDSHGWMELNMLSGESRVFQGNAMVGVMPLNMPAWGDSLHVQLGYDDDIRTSKTLLQDDSGTRWLSGKRVIEQVRQINVHNLGKQGVAIEVVEEFPMASGWDVRVEPTHGGMWNEDTGEVTWAKIELPASGTWEATVIVRITVPKSSGHLVGF